MGLCSGYPLPPTHSPPDTHPHNQTSSSYPDAQVWEQTDRGLQGEVATTWRSLLSCPGREPLQKSSCGQKDNDEPFWEHGGQVSRWPWPQPPRGARWFVGGTACCSQVDRPWLRMNLGERVLWTSHTFIWICSVPNRPWGRKLKGLEDSRIWSKHRAPGTPEAQSWGLPRRPPHTPQHSTSLKYDNYRDYSGLPPPPLPQRWLW